ncbi:MAG: RNA polymerase sigma factor [Phycisphaeraceae bacterium]|nr:RNA polymerase sigma factor [Phycisphaeraceae bacterium]
MTDGLLAEMSREMDADLLVYMSMSAEDAASAQAAWETLYRRHVRYVWAVCRRAYADLLGGDEGAADLVSETFRRAYEFAGTFDAHGVQDVQRQQRMVRAWLCRIAQRLAQDALRGRARMPTVAMDQEPPAVPAEPADSPRVVLAREALAMLSEKEQIVLRATMQWYQPQSPHQRLPNDVCRDIAQTLGTTPENLRQIRRRAMEKVRHYMEEHRR